MSDRSITGYRVLVTRPAHQSAGLVAAIEGAGGKAIRFPVIQIEGRDADTVKTEIASLPPPDVVIFVSRNAVDFGAAALGENSASIAAIGPATKSAIEGLGASVDIYPDAGFNSEHLLAHPALANVRDKAITIVCGENGREHLGDTLKKRGAAVSYLATYRRRMRSAPAEEIVALDSIWRSGGIDCVTVMSAETLQNLLQLLPSTSVELLRRTPIVAPGARVIQTALELMPGIPAVMASGPRAADMLNALIEARHSGTN